MKRQNGITLIALVITIIVLLILAGVSISMVIGNNGILNQASTAGVETRGASEKEQVELAFLSAKTKQLRGAITGEIDDTVLKTELTANGVMENVSSVEYDEDTKVITVKFKSGNVFILEDDIVTWDRAQSGVPTTPTISKIYLDPEAWDYTIDSTTGEATITGYKVSGATTVTIPNYIKGDGDEEDIPVTKIAGTIEISDALNTTLSSGKGIWSDYDGYASAYVSGQNTVKEIIVSEGIKVIDVGAFMGTVNLESITLPNTLTEIGDFVFTSCLGLESITIPDNVTNIGERAFYYCLELKSVVMPNSLTSIGNSAFYQCNALTSITIPNRVTSIGEDAFHECADLTEVRFEMTTAPTFGADCFNTRSDTIMFYFKNSSVREALIEETHYNASNGTKSEDYSW